MKPEKHKRWSKHAGKDHKSGELEQLWNVTESYKEHYEPDVESGWHRFKERIDAEKAPANVIRMQSRRRFLAVAASVAIIISLIGLWKNWYAAPKSLLHTTLTDEQQEVRLPDGSLVILNESSEVEFLSSFKKENKRLIRLSGEAYFDVVPNAEKPFVILTEESEVKVLGTAFNVRAYRGEAYTEVSVERGKVAFSSKVNKEQVLLEAGQKGMWMHSEKMLKEELSNLNEHAWRTAQLNFRKSPLKEVKLTLERYYKVQIELDDRLTDCSVTFNFDNESLENVLETRKL